MYCSVDSFFPYDPRPEMLKKKTDAALKLLDEINKKKYDKEKLKPRELRAIYQVKHFLDHCFGVPYDDNFYTADWMMGPNYFCWQPICNLGYDMNAVASHAKLRTKEDVLKIIDRIRSHNMTIDNYIGNLKLGVKAGMVRAQIDCNAGLDALKERYKSIGAKQTAEAVLQEWYAKLYLSSSFYKQLNTSVNDTWLRLYGKPIQESIKEALIDGFGKPMLKLMRYLEFNHSVHCLPNYLSSGLGNLPVDYVYYNGKPNTNEKTTKMLPLTSIRLSGKVSYRKHLSFFTTTKLTASDIFKEGQKELDIFYPEIIKITKTITGLSDKDQAIKTFRKKLDSAEMWHGELKFPENESNQHAYKTCTDDASAKKYCPVRWKSIQKWAGYCQMVMSMIYPKISKLFYFAGEKNTVPNCPVVMWPHYNPSNGAMFFDKSDAQCSEATKFGLPFFLEKYGPKFQEWSVIGHEARPGHHTQYQGIEEHFRDKCGGLPRWVDKMGYYVVFIEGWALYSENPLLSKDVDLYKENLLQKYGMLKWQTWRAVRLIVDTGLHDRGENQTWAKKQFSDYTWDETDFARKEIVRYMSDPGQATAYMLGRLELIKMRKKAEKELGKNFNIKDFHYQILSQGSSPIDYLWSYINRYIECRKNDKLPLCEYILTPVSTLKGTATNQNNNEEMEPPRPPRRHYV